MSDINKCEGIECPIRNKCYRFLVPDDDFQAYFIITPFAYDYCDKFISYEEEMDLTKLKFKKCQI